MKILFLSRWYPFPADNGSKIRIFNILKQLGVKHDVTLLSFRDSRDAVSDDSLAVLREFCGAVESVGYRPYQSTSTRSLLGLFSKQPRFLVDTYNSDMSIAAQVAARKGDYNLVVASQLDMVPYALGLGNHPLLLEELEVGTFLNATRGSMPIAQRSRAVLTWLKLRSYLHRTLPRFGACTVVSDLERAEVERIAPGATRIQTIVNAVDTSQFNGPYGMPVANSILFSGALTYSANFDALQYFLNDIYPIVRRTLPDTNLSVTGSTAGVDLARLPRLPGVHFTGYLPDIRPTVAENWVSVVPLRQGGGTRLKILESMGLGTPVVSTSKGAEGLAVADGQNILLGDNPDRFARQVVDVLTSSGLRQRLSANGRQLVESRYDWQIVGQELRDLVEQVVA